MARFIELKDFHNTPLTVNEESIAIIRPATYKEVHDAYIDISGEGAKVELEKYAVIELLYKSEQILIQGSYVDVRSKFYVENAKTTIKVGLK